MSLKTFNAQEVVLTVAGIVIGGYDDGTYITIGRDNPSFTSGTGSDGEGWRSKSNDKSGTCTVTLLRSSASNDLLSALSALDEASGDGVGPLLLKDLAGTSIYESEDCWIEKPADAEFARDKTSREWVFKMTVLIPFAGGN